MWIYEAHIQATKFRRALFVSNMHSSYQAIIVARSTAVETTITITWCRIVFPKCERMERKISTIKSFTYQLVLKLHPIIWWTLDKSPVDEEKLTYIFSTVILDKLTAENNTGQKGRSDWLAWIVFGHTKPTKKTTSASILLLINYVNNFVIFKFYMKFVNLFNFYLHFKFK